MEFKIPDHLQYSIKSISLEANNNLLTTKLGKIYDNKEIICSFDVKDTLALLYKENLLNSLERYGESISYNDKILEIDPNNTNAVIEKGTALQEQSASNLSQKQDSEGQNKSSNAQPPISIKSNSTFSEGNSFYILGEIKNNQNKTLNLVKAYVELYNITKNKIGSISTFTTPSTIQPFESAAFKLSIGPTDVDNVSSIDSWKLYGGYR
ncbi:FxLYD domain-containing protein [Candidatus Nitrosocosmicus sp. R]